jgi:hypothetical protein
MDESEGKFGQEMKNLDDFLLGDDSPLKGDRKNSDDQDRNLDRL